jgi:hypothetical protein
LIAVENPDRMARLVRIIREKSGILGADALLPKTSWMRSPA